MEVVHHRHCHRSIRPLLLRSQLRLGHQTVSLLSQLGVDLTRYGTRNCPMHLVVQLQDAAHILLLTTLLVVLLVASSLVTSGSCSFFFLTILGSCHAQEPKRLIQPSRLILYARERGRVSRPVNHQLFFDSVG